MNSYPFERVVSSWWAESNDLAHKKTSHSHYYEQLPDPFRKHVKTIHLISQNCLRWKLYKADEHYFSLEMSARSRRKIIGYNRLFRFSHGATCFFPSRLQTHHECAIITGALLAGWLSVDRCRWSLSKYVVLCYVCKPASEKQNTTQKKHISVA